MRNAIDKPELYVLKPQREGGGEIFALNPNSDKYTRTTALMVSIPTSMVLVHTHTKPDQFKNPSWNLLCLNSYNSCAYLHLLQFWLLFLFFNLGNNIYGTDVRETLKKLRNEGNDGLAAYILMQRIFPKDSRSYLIRDGISHTENTISELGIYGAYLRYNSGHSFS